METSPKYRPLTFGVTRVTLRDGAPWRALPAGRPGAARASRAAGRPAAALGGNRAGPHLHGAPRSARRRQPWATGGTSRYAQAWASARGIAQALLDRGLSAERPVVILSENDLDHALLALGCLVAGVPFVPTSPPYSLISTDYSKLRHVLATTTPGLVFAADGARYGKAIAGRRAAPTSK